MANGKKSVLLYCDIIHTVEKLSDIDAGLLFKHYLRYINDLDPLTDNAMVDIVFEGIKQNLKRDLKKWEQRAERSRENGALGGRPKNPTEPIGLNNNPTKPRKPDTVTVTDTGKVNVNDIKENASPVLFENPDLNEIFHKWIYACASEVKMSVRKNYGASAIEAMAMKLNYMRPAEAEATVRQSLENGWVTLRPLPDNWKPETKKDMVAKAFMQKLDQDFINETLYPHETVQPNINDQEPPCAGGLQGVPALGAGRGTGETDK